MKVLGLIPARGGSKRLPGKNLKVLHGKSLLQWAIDAAKEADCLDEIVVSSDHPPIRHMALKHGAQIIERPAALAQDDTTSYEVMLDALGFYEEIKGISFDYLCLLQPTSPLRTAEDIRRAVNAATQIGKPVSTFDDTGKRTPNGAVYVGKASWLRDGGNFDTDTHMWIGMLPERSIDIDTLEDFEEAERIMGESLTADI